MWCSPYSHIYCRSRSWDVMCSNVQVTWPREAATVAALLLVPRLPTRLNTGAAAAGLFTNTAELQPVVEMKTKVHTNVRDHGEGLTRLGLFPGWKCLLIAYLRPLADGSYAALVCRLYHVFSTLQHFVPAFLARTRSFPGAGATLPSPRLLRAAAQ